MKRKIAILLIMVLSVSSCTLFNDSNLGFGKRVARIGTSVLYESEIAELMPTGVSPEDSMEMVKQYINTWALGQLMERQAKSQLSKSERDISKEIDDFKSDILAFRYQKHYIEERLDTLVTREETRQYYDEHQENFTAVNSIVKCRVIRISPNSPYYEMVKDDFDRSELSLSADTKEHFISLTEKYIDYSSQWTEVATMAREMGIRESDFESRIITDSGYETDVDDMHFLIYVFDYVKAGALSPYDYNEQKIREIIISKRKQQLLSDLELEVLREATIHKKLKIY